MIGRHINNYEVTALLGSGGMGEVYLAQHAFMGRKAAVKVLHAELARNEGLVGRFFNEARAANAIRHPNIIDIIDVGMLPEDGTPFLLMEFLEGESLLSRLAKTRPLDLAAAIDIAAQAASALAAAHSKGIVHRDLKPDNLFLVPDPLCPRGERVKVLDFGIAKLRGEMRGNSEKTQTGTVMGTALYMSPEQCQGLVENIDLRSDIYSLGIILHEMLSGAPPFSAEGFADMIIAHVLHAPRPLTEINPAVPEFISQAVLRALEKKPEMRFQSMDEFQAALHRPGTAVQAIGTDATLFTPPPVPLTIRPPTQPPRKETTLRAAAGESTSSIPTMRDLRGGKTKTFIAAGVGVGILAAAAIVLFSRPSGTSTTPAPIVAPVAAPVAAPAPPPAVIPLPAPAPEPAPPPAAAPAPEPEVKPVLANERPSRPSGRSSGRGRGKPSGAAPVISAPSPVVPPPPPPRQAEPAIEKW